MSSRKYTPETVVEFYASLGYVGANHRDAETVESLLGDVEGWTDADIEEALHEAFDTWLWNHLDAGWGVLDDPTA